MALNKCRDCGNEISSKAKSCPKCGAPNKPKKSRKLLVFLIISGVLISIISSGNDLVKSAKKRQADSSSTKTAAGKTATTFTEKDIGWDQGTKDYKDIVIKGVNKVYAENSNCHTLDTYVIISKQKSTPQNPVFFVGCKTAGGEPFNAFFSKSDVEGGKSFKAAAHIDQHRAKQLCEEYAKANANNPSTVDFSYLMDAAVQDYPNGRTRVVSSFTAKNKLGLELKFNIDCLLDANGLLDGTITER